MKPAFNLHSDETGSDYHIYTVAPSTAESSEVLPCILFMDGDDQFSAAAEAYRGLRKAKKIPPLLLVGVGYGASYSKPANRRGRDYTPTQHSDEPTSGGANTFLSFLSVSLWPELQRRYRIDDSSRGIAGHSLGSLLVLHALWHEPPFFNRFLASSPSIWWDDRSILHIAEDRHRRNPILIGKLFLSVGEADSKSMTGDLTLLEQWLERAPFRGLIVRTELFQKRNHFNVLPDAFRTGLTTLYGSEDDVRE